MNKNTITGFKVVCTLLIGTVIVLYPFYYYQINEHHKFSFQKIFFETVTNESWQENELVNTTSIMYNIENQINQNVTNTSISSTGKLKTKKLPEMIIIGN
jgi:hypothetical protein